MTYKILLNVNVQANISKRLMLPLRRFFVILQSPTQSAVIVITLGTLFAPLVSVTV